MINAIVMELNVASEVTFRKQADSEYATLLGIQNAYAGQNRTSKLPISLLLQGNCVEYARKVELGKGRRIIVHGRLTYSEQHKSFTLKADQLSAFPLSKSKLAGGDDVAASGAEPSDAGLESKTKQSTKTNTK
jgi:hypothetical protein